jgi:16S rRNA A1518/A1519 N6-dimethyltransferase RsmA/KsgA/DIM1 with predicted DNA glycosylase/AP lyase activity
LEVGEPEGFLRFVATCFRQKRKTLRNNLRGTYGARAVEALTQADLSPRSRAEELSAGEFAQVYRYLAGADRAWDK